MILEFFTLQRYIKNLWRPEDFASDLLVLKLVIHRTINKFRQLGDFDGGDFSVVGFKLYCMRLRFYAVNEKEVMW